MGATATRFPSLTVHDSFTHPLADGGTTAAVRPSGAGRLGCLRARVARRRKALGVVATIALAFAGVWFAARGVDPAGLAATFRGVHLGWVAAGACAAAIQILTFGVAWRTGLRAAGVGEVPLRHTVGATWIGKAGNAVLPARMGEVARVMIIRRHLPPEHGSIALIAGTLIAQRILGSLATLIVVMLVAVTMPLPVPIPDLPLLAAAAGSLILGALVLRGRLRVGTRLMTLIPRRLRGLFGTIITGAGVLRLRGPAIASIGMHLVAVVAQLTTVACLLHAFGVAAPASAPLVVLAMVTLAGLLPAAPGGIGVAQAAVVAPLGATYGVSANLALGFALGLQATIIVVAVVGGLLSLTHQRFVRSAAPTFA